MCCITIHLTGNTFTFNNCCIGKLLYMYFKDYQNEKLYNNAFSKKNMDLLRFHTYTKPI